MPSSYRRRPPTAATDDGGHRNGAGAGAGPRDLLKRWRSLRERLIPTDRGRVEDFYDLGGRTLGQGGFGAVRPATRKATGGKFAAKVIQKKNIESVAGLQQEIEISKSMDHPGIVRLYESFQDHWNVYLIMELCSGGELFDQIVEAGHFSERQAAILVKQMLQALSYMHAQGVCHRDLKPENFLFANRGAVDATPIKLIDFGLSRRFTRGQILKTCVGTPAYVAPEVLGKRYGPACDLWGCGVIVYILLSGAPPFDADDDATMLKLVNKGHYSFRDKIWRHVSQHAKALIAKLLEKNPEARLTAAQALDDPWIRETAPGSDNAVLPSTLLSNLKSFGLQNRFKQAVLTEIATRLSDWQIQNLKQSFLALDQNNDGYVSAAELRDGLHKMGMQVPTDLHAIIDAVEASSEGRVEYTTFLAAALDARIYAREEVCWRAFKTFDLDEDGAITLDELKNILGHEDVQALPEAKAVEEAMREVDVDSDGRIDFAEFMRMMGAGAARA